MSIKDIIIGVDLDGVCANFYGHMRAIAAEWFECNILTSRPKSHTVSASGESPVRSNMRVCTASL